MTKTATLTFAAGVTQQIFAVTSNGDNTIELNEIFNVVLSSATGASIGTATGIVTTGRRRAWRLSRGFDIPQPGGS